MTENAVHVGIINKVVEIAHLRIEVDDIITSARESRDKRLTPTKRGVVIRKRHLIGKITSEVLADLKKLSVGEKDQLATKFPLLKMLVDRANKNMPPTK